jgi:molybdopterin converting factor small subunit
VIRVLLFGTLAAKAKSREIEIEATKEISVVADVLAKVVGDYLDGDAGVYMLALNETQAKPETPVKDGDEVAIMPPFSGG